MLERIAAHARDLIAADSSAVYLPGPGDRTLRAIVALGPIADGDIYWHLAAGAEMWRRHDLLRADPFTVSAAGRAWIDVHWLFQLAAAAIHRRT